LNTLARINTLECRLKDIANNTLSNLVCFGASAASTRVLKILHDIRILPRFVCDNDPGKEGTPFHGYSVQAPNALFSRQERFFVIIASMYYREIETQLARYPNVSGTVFYLDLFPTDLMLSSTRTPFPQHPLPCTFNPDIRLYVRYEGPARTAQYEADLEKARQFGISGFLEPDTSRASPVPCLSYSSYANRIIAEARQAEALELFETRYNFDPLHYGRLLEFFLFDRYRRGDTVRPIVLEGWPLLCEANFLDATAAVMNVALKAKWEFAAKTQRQGKSKDHALVWHLYHVEMFDEMLTEMSVAIDRFDIYISVNPACPLETLEQIAASLPRARLFLFENRGRDILPFLNIFKTIAGSGYETLCKIHTKHSIYRNDGSDWGKTLRTRLFDACDKVLEAFAEDPHLGAFVAEGNLRDIHPYLDVNGENIRFLCELLEVGFRDDFRFPLGTMFWARLEAITQLSAEALEGRYFMLEGGGIDGQIEHAVEMLIGLLIASNGFTIREV